MRPGFQNAAVAVVALLFAPLTLLAQGEIKLPATGLTVAASLHGDRNNTPDWSLLNNAGGMYSPVPGGNAIRWGAHLELSLEHGWRSYLVRVTRLEAEMSQPQFPRLDAGNRMNYSRFTTMRYSAGARHYFRPPNSARRGFVELSGGIEQLNAPLLIMNEVSPSNLSANGPYWAASVGTQFAPVAGFRIEAAAEIGHSQYGAWQIDGATREGGNRLTGWSYGLRIGLRRSVW